MHLLCISNFLIYSLRSKSYVLNNLVLQVKFDNVSSHVRTRYERCVSKLGRNEFNYTVAFQNSSPVVYTISSKHNYTVHVYAKQSCTVFDLQTTYTVTWSILPQGTKYVRSDEYRFLSDLVCLIFNRKSEHYSIRQYVENLIIVVQKNGKFFKSVLLF